MEAQTADPRHAALQTDISRVVRTLMAWRSVRQNELAEKLGMTEPTISKKLHGSRAWTLDDLVSLSETFDLPVKVFVSDPDSLLSHLSGIGYEPTTELSLIDGKVPDRAERKSGNRPLLASVVT